MGTKGKIKKKNRERKQDRNDSHRNTAMEQLNTEPQDHISWFPDDILFRIISFLPFESAVHTTFLSKQWKDLWKKNLILNTTMEDIIVTILNLIGFSLFPLHLIEHLDFSPAEQEFPASFDWLLPLRLPSAYKPDEMIMKLNPPLSLYAQIKIKTLYLVSVSHLSSKAVTCLVSNLPFLESLIIEKCNGVQSLVVQDAGVLQKLIVLDCPQLRTLSFQETKYASMVDENLQMDPKCYNLTSSIPENFLAIVGAPENLNGLKVVKLEGFVGEQMEIFVARRLVPLFGENNPVIISKSYGKCLKHLVKVDKLENKATYSYKFKMVENVDEKNSLSYSYEPLI
ncbi:hypothetical protein Gohar_024657 [Gossypium harknessii]|uniref:F-box domain-containing protein n=1 Tax=Gossypium harknessii TaxID=34285 RepID=A0A7J9HGJ6_9ROSI|nr:hypothetical protein [Gossypium harknessii]